MSGVSASLREKMDVAGVLENGYMHENVISGIVLDRALHIHRSVGPGLYESVYERLLEYELATAGLKVRRQVDVPIVWAGIQIESAFRADLVIEGKVLVEIKSVEDLARVHHKQVITYLRLSGMRLGLLVNFGAPVLKEGFVRLVNGFEGKVHAEPRCSPRE